MDNYRDKLPQFINIQGRYLSDVLFITQWCKTAFYVLSRNRKIVAVSSFFLTLFASQIREFFLPQPEFSRFSKVSRDRLLSPTLCFWDRVFEICYEAELFSFISYHPQRKWSARTYRILWLNPSVYLQIFISSNNKCEKINYSFLVIQSYVQRIMNWKVTENSNVDHNA